MKINIYRSVKSYILLFSLIVIVGFASCEKFLDVNNDPDSPVESQVGESVLLPGVEGVISYTLIGGYPARFPNYWIGQVSSSGEAPIEETFHVLPADVNNTWTYDIYTGALKNAVLLMKKAESNGNYHYLGISQVLIAQTLAITTDLWGDIPWTEAFHFPEILKPKFDSQQSIYSEVFRLLDEGIVNLKRTETQTKYPGNDDLLFSGNIDSWIKYAYSLKARYALRLTYAPGKTGAAQADSALSAIATGFASNNDNAEFEYFGITDRENPWYQWGVKWTSAFANTFMLNLMKINNDPRISKYFCATELDTTYVGHRNGTNVNPAGSVSIIVGIDLAGDPLTNYIESKSSLPWMTYSELKFIEAEAYIWKSDYVNAKIALDAAIKANMERIEVKADSITAFIGRLGSMPTTFEAAQKLIIEQKYIANFLSLENWNDYRRTGYPGVSVADTDDPSEDNIPVRFMYSSDVRSFNADNMPKNIDWLTTRLWWDAKVK
jgi:hypothetical protein